MPLRRRQLKVKMRNSLHGRAISIPNNMDKNEAATILKSELRPKTPIDTGRARSNWNANNLASGDVRVENQVPYIRRLMIDGSSKQQRPGAHLRAIELARARIEGRRIQIEAVEEFLTGKVDEVAKPQVRGQILTDIFGTSVIAGAAAGAVAAVGQTTNLTSALVDTVKPDLGGAVETVKHVSSREQSSGLTELIGAGLTIAVVTSSQEGTTTELSGF